MPKLLTRNGTPKKPVIKGLVVRIDGNPLIVTWSDRKNILRLKKLCIENPTHFDSILRAKRYREKYAELNAWIWEKTPALTDSERFSYRLKTRIYWIFNGLTDFPKCLNEDCDNRIGLNSDVESIRLGYAYRRHCSVRCAASDRKVKEKSRATEELRHGRPNYRNSEAARNTCLERYGVSNYAKTDAYRKTCRRKLKRSKEKEVASKKKNGTLNTSRPEKACYLALVRKFGKSCVRTEYKSDRYPFFCDFYVESLDLFIECNFHWTHGGHPYSEASDSDTLKLWRKRAKKSKFYSVAIKTWTVRDVRKRLFAKENRLNYLEFWKPVDFMKWIDSLN